MTAIGARRLLTTSQFTAEWIIPFVFFGQAFALLSRPLPAYATACDGDTFRNIPQGISGTFLLPICRHGCKFLATQ
jgi:hypothetical protein